MVEQQPASFTQGACANASTVRDMLGDMPCTEGVANIKVGALTVAPASPASMNVTVSSGGAFIDGETVPYQGTYHVYNDGTKTLAVAANSTGATRIDLVIAHVYDAQYAGTLNEWHLEVVTGTASAPALPTNAIPLALISVPNGATSITAANITDQRQPAQWCSESVPGNVKPNVQAAIAEASSAQTFASGQWITVKPTYAPESTGFQFYSDGSWHALQSGLYLVSATAQWGELQATPTGFRGIRIIQGGSSKQSVLSGPSTNYVSASPVVTELLRLNVGDSIAMQVYQNSGVTQQLWGNYGWGLSTTFSASRVGS